MLRSQAARLHTLILVIDMALSACLLAVVLSRPEFEAVIRTPGLGLLGVVLAGTFSLPILFDWVGLYGSQRRTQLSELLGRMALAAVVSITAIGAMIVVTGSPLTLDFALLVGGSSSAWWAGCASRSSARCASCAAMAATTATSW